MDYPNFNPPTPDFVKLSETYAYDSKLDRVLKAGNEVRNLEAQETPQQPFQYQSELDLLQQMVSDRLQVLNHDPETNLLIIQSQRRQIFKEIFPWIQEINRIRISGIDRSRQELV